MQNFREDETGGRDRERYDDERVDPGGWMVNSWRMHRRRLLGALGANAPREKVQWVPGTQKNSDLKFKFFTI